MVVPTATVIGSSVELVLTNALLCTLLLDRRQIGSNGLALGARVRPTVFVLLTGILSPFHGRKYAFDGSRPKCVFDAGKFGPLSIWKQKDRARFHRDFGTIRDKAAALTRSLGFSPVICRPVRIASKNIVRTGSRRTPESGAIRSDVRPCFSRTGDLIHNSDFRCVRLQSGNVLSSYRRHGGFDDFGRHGDRGFTCSFPPIKFSGPFFGLRNPSAFCNSRSLQGR